MAQFATHKRTDAGRTETINRRRARALKYAVPMSDADQDKAIRVLARELGATVVPPVTVPNQSIASAR